MQFRNITILILAIFAAGCTSRPYHVPGLNHLQICQDIKRQLIFLNNNDPTLYPYEYRAGTWSSPTRQALLLRKYREFECDQVLGECVPQAVHRQGLSPLPDASPRK